MAQLSFFVDVIFWIGVLMIVGQVWAHKDRLHSPQGIKYVAVSSAPGIALVALGWVLGHGLPWHAVFTAIFFASVMAASILQILRTVGRIKEPIPRWTIVWLVIDACILSYVATGQASPAAWHPSTFPDHVYQIVAIIGQSAMGTAALAWLSHTALSLILGPELARRRTEADAAVAQLDRIERGG